MSKKIQRLLAALSIFLVALACNEHGLVPFDEAIEVEKQDITTQFVTNKIDILWVVDNSGSMREEQDALTYNFYEFVTGIAEINTDFHMAVITTDMDSDNGVMRTAPGGVGPGGVNLDCPNVVGPVLTTDNYVSGSGVDTDRLALDFACIATVGITGSGFEQGLEAMRESFSAALTEGNGPNAGFRRNDAWLAIIFVTDENDCSTPPGLLLNNSKECEWSRDLLVQPQEYIDFLKSLPGTAEGEQILIAGIIGPDDGHRPNRNEDPRPSCSVPEVGTVCAACSDGQGEWECVDSELICACEAVEASGFCASGEAYAGYRYEEVINAFGDRGGTSNICQDSFREALLSMQRVIRSNLAVKCLRSLPRTCEDRQDCAPGVECGNPGDPNAGPGLCMDFEIVVEQRPSESEEPWTEVPGPDTAEPSYVIDYEAATCPTGIGIEFTSGNEPGLGEEFRIRYPIVLGTEQPEE